MGYDRLRGLAHYHAAGPILVNDAAARVSFGPVTHPADSMSDTTPSDETCPVPRRPDESAVAVVALSPQPSPPDYLAAMQLAKAEATARLGEHMLLSWYDRDRDFEAPQHVSECHRDAAVPGYVDYALYRGATLKVDIEQGRFVFYYLPVDF
jgi:hypothetical protein